MRLALVGQWLRVASRTRRGDRTALRYALGITVVQVGWLLRLLLPESWFAPAFIVLVAAELAVPVWAEAAGRTPWHPHHIVERYGLFTIIVLGESVLGATLAVQAALDADSTFVDLAAVVGRRPAARCSRCGGSTSTSRRSGWWTRPGGSSRSGWRSCVRVGLRALRRVRLRGRGRGGAGGVDRPGHRSLRPLGRRRPAWRPPCPWRCTS